MLSAWLNIIIYGLTFALVPINAASVSKLFEVVLDLGPQTSEVIVDQIIRTGE